MKESKEVKYYTIDSYYKAVEVVQKHHGDWVKAKDYDQLLEAFKRVCNQVFNESYEDQEWRDIGADLRIKIREEFSKRNKLARSEAKRMGVKIG